MDDNTKLENENKTIKQETKSMVTKLENKSLEAKLLKGNIDELNREKNALNVALKTIKQDMKSKNESFEKEISAYEKKVFELNEFKTKKLDEEKREKLMKKKELKREAKKTRNNNNTIINEKLAEVEKNSEENSEVHEEKGSKPIISSREQSPHRIVGEASLPSDSDSACLKTLSVKTSEEKYKNIELEEKEEGFIGPRLPRMLTDDEVKAIFDKLLGDKYG